MGVPHRMVTRISDMVTAATEGIYSILFQTGSAADEMHAKLTAQRGIQDIQGTQQSIAPEGQAGVRPKYPIF